MRILFKIILAPIVAALFVLSLVMTFIFGIAGALLKFVCGFCVILSIVFFIAGFMPNGIFFIILAFLISPVGLPLIADLLTEGIVNLNCAFINFIVT